MFYQLIQLILSFDVLSTYSTQLVLMFYQLIQLIVSFDVLSTYSTHC